MAPGSVDQMAELYRASGRAWIIGVTGVPGSGKSTLVGAMAVAFRKRGQAVGIVAVDPSSPYSGGSLLGDRIRLGHLTSDDGVFVRSMASRGALGGLAWATSDVVSILDASGKDVVLIETVGVGQDEVEIASTSHTTIVVSVPGLGDEVQAMKAGVIEIADIHVVNKADRDGADRTSAELQSLLQFSLPASGLGAKEPDNWSTPVTKTVAATGDGVDHLIDLVSAHHEWLARSGELERRERSIAERRVRSVTTHLIDERLSDPTVYDGFAALIDQVRLRAMDPHGAAALLLAQMQSDVVPDPLFKRGVQ